MGKDAGACCQGIDCCHASMIREVCVRSRTLLANEQRGGLVLVNVACDTNLPRSLNWSFQRKSCLSSPSEKPQVTKNVFITCRFCM